MAKQKEKTHHSPNAKNEVTGNEWNIYLEAAKLKARTKEAKEEKK